MTDRERSEAMEKAIHANAKKSGREVPNLEDYLVGCSSQNVIDHALRPKAFNAFYIHPHGVDGPTMDFFIHADGRVTLQLPLGSPETVMKREGGE